MEIIQIPVDLHGSDIRIRRVHALLAIRKVLETLEQCLAEHAEHIESIARQFDDSSYDTRELWLNEVMLNNRLTVARELHRRLVQYIPTQQTYEALAHPALCDNAAYAEHVQRFMHIAEHSRDTHPEARALVQRIGNIASTAALDYACGALKGEGSAKNACAAKLEFLWKFCERGFVDLALAYSQTRGAKLSGRVQTKTLAIEKQLSPSKPIPLVGSVKARDAAQWYSIERARSIVPKCYSDPLQAFEKLACMLEKYTVREAEFFESCFFAFRVEPERCYIAEQLRRECFHQHIVLPMRECIRNSLDSVVRHAYLSRDIVNLVGMHARAPFENTRARLAEHIHECCIAQIAHLAKQTRNTKKVITATVLLCHAVCAFDFRIAEQFSTTLMNFCSRYTEHRHRTREKKQRCIRRLERYWNRIVDYSEMWKKISEYIGLYIQTKRIDS